MSNRRQVLQASLGAAMLAALKPAAAQTVEQVKIYYGFPAGSSGDSVARRVGEKLGGSQYTRNAAVVENRPGAGGRIALDVLKTAPSDGSASQTFFWKAVPIRSSGVESGASQSP